MGGIEDVQKRGKSEAGQKTMLDMVPAAKRLENEIEQGSCNKDIIENVIKAAEVGCGVKTIGTERKSLYLGERSIGHIDPGAMSSLLLIKAICNSIDVENE